MRGLVESSYDRLAEAMFLPVNILLLDAQRYGCG